VILINLRISLHLIFKGRHINIGPFQGLLIWIELIVLGEDLRREVKQRFDLFIEVIEDCWQKVIGQNVIQKYKILLAVENLRF
jgi:hypothetical protein